MPAAQAGPTPSPVPWSEDFACGEMLIDEQHRTLFTHVNQMLAAFEAAPGVGALAFEGGMLDKPHLRQAERLPEPIFTPSTKAAVGNHDENIAFLFCALDYAPSA